MLNSVNFSNPNGWLKYESEPVKITATTDKFGIYLSNRPGKSVVECPTSEISKIQLVQLGGHYWLRFYLNDGQLIELRHLAGYSDAYSPLHHQLKLVLAEAKRLAKSSGSKRSLKQSVDNLLNARLITPEVATSIRAEIDAYL